MRLKEKWKKILFLLPLFIVAGAFYLMFKDCYKAILIQLKQTSIVLLLLIVLMGLLYILLDSAVYRIMVGRELKGYTLKHALQMEFLGIFLNVTTFGPGIVPGQTYYMSRMGLEPGRGMSILVLYTAVHKVSVLVYATVMLLVHGTFLNNTFSGNLHYLYGGYGLSILVILFLVLICTSKKFHSLLFFPLDRCMKSPKWAARKEKWKREVENLRKESVKLLKNWKMVVCVVGVNLLKLSCWYIIPLLTLHAVDVGNMGVSVLDCLATSSIMQVLIAIIPNTGGMGSTEVVYTLLYGELFGRITAGSTMLLYRLSNYYLPFVISTAAALKLRKNWKKEEQSLREREA